ncbi:DNA-directed RNA polymerase III subunit RPC6 [Plectosphaerella cucumerina]|uniref:DNA-directed RNA polymerase III subunit RPC6 n=1 Tax=Plectosphaerella cucumerina TaxID=40658 RepID=A0A8K0TNQ8_9PEZI|nr:DNA-directed RNA polymerase III subunit RPC6 [Plectosphaerella cucumerina]
MPEPSPSTATTASSTDPAKLDVLKQAIYEAMRENGEEDRLYSQYDLLDLDIIPDRDAQLLLKTVQSLTNDKLLVVVSVSGGLAWRYRSREEAKKYTQCTTDEQRLVYGLIDEAGGDGIWTKTIMGRLGMNDAVMKTALKQLQTKGLIAPFKNVEHPNKKMYIKASMRPSERATGGPWFTDQMLDEAFIEDLQRVVFDFVKRESTHTPKSEGRTAVPKKGVINGNSSGSSSRKRAAGEISTDDAAATNGTVASSVRVAAVLPYPAGYTAYPTVRDIARFISQSGITTETILGEEDVQKLVDVLIYDGLVEPVRVGGRNGFRVSRTAQQSSDTWAGRGGQDDDTGIERGAPTPYTNGYTEAPCGRCPVFDLCEEGGPVSASNCQYFQQWLGLE